MGIFLGGASDQHYARDFENQMKQSKVKWYITTNMHDKVWQEYISTQVQVVNEHHKSISIILRLFRRELIQDRNLKSITKYKKLNRCLYIDILLDMDKYLDLPEKEVKELMCDDIFDYVKSMLKKYQKNLYNIDVEAFLPLFKERIEYIKNGVFEDNFHLTDSYKNLIFAEEFMNKVKNQGVEPAIS